MTTRRETLLASMGMGVLTPGARRKLADAAPLGSPNINSVASIIDLERLTGTSGQCIYLSEPGRSGVFIFDQSNLASAITSDPEKGVYIAPSGDPRGSSGAWIRQYEGPIHATWFGVVADGLADDTKALNGAAIMALRKKQALIMPAGTLLITETVRLATSTYGAGEASTRIVTLTADFDAVVIANAADFLELRGFGVQTSKGKSSGRGIVFERENNNIVVERLFVGRFAIGFDLAALNFVQAYRMLRADECDIGFSCDGRDTDGSGNGTSLSFQQCYANDCRIGFDIRYVSSVSFNQAIVDLKSSTSICIRTVGVGTVNAYDFHFEGTPGVNGAYFDFITIGNLGSTLNIFGGYIDGADLTGRDFKLIRIAGNNDTVDVNIHGLGSRNIELAGNDAFLLNNSTGFITLSIHGSIYPALSVDSSKVSGAFRVKDYTLEGTGPQFSGAELLSSGESIATGLNKKPYSVVQINNENLEAKLIHPVVAGRSSNGKISVRFFDSSGAEFTATPLLVAWIAW